MNPEEAIAHSHTLANTILSYLCSLEEVTNAVTWSESDLDDYFGGTPEDHQERVEIAVAEALTLRRIVLYSDRDNWPPAVVAPAAEPYFLLAHGGNPTVLTKYAGTTGTCYHDIVQRMASSMPIGASVETLLRNPSGKQLRHELRRRVEEILGSEWHGTNEVVSILRCHLRKEAVLAWRLASLESKGPSDPVASIPGTAEPDAPRLFSSRVDDPDLVELIMRIDAEKAKPKADRMSASKIYRELAERSLAPGLPPEEKEEAIKRKVWSLKQSYYRAKRDKQIRPGD